MPKGARVALLSVAVAPGGLMMASQIWGMEMNKVQLRRRKMFIIAELTKLSHLGWDKCRREDWQPLEDELNAINMR